ncbi:MAG: SixA phosphatase family protein [Paracoccaceae bacterium]
MPRYLILMRHAKSSWKDPALDDHDRPLNRRGRRAASALGGWMRDRGWVPDEVLCSTARRTRETLRRLDLPGAPTVRERRALYLAEPEAMLEVLRGAQGACVLMLGHNPGIAEFAHRLIAAPPPHARFAGYPTGATLVAEFLVARWDQADWARAEAVDFVVPRDLD